MNYLQQKSAVDSSLLDQPHLGEDKNFGGQNNFNSFSAFVDPISPIVSAKHLQSKDFVDHSIVSSYKYTRVSA